jgi:2-keto-4-pentenoate hydratase/2-oxohepta-3-ene-1,7-dioic acid hydratase in catechol pathway
MTRVLFALLAACMLAPTLAPAQAVTPFKLGTFERAGRAFVGIVLREAVVIDFAAAHKAIQTPASTVAPPADMKDLLVRYDQGLRARILDVIRSVEAAGAARPSYVFDVKAVKILPPVMPTSMLNMAVNYAEHDREAAALGNQVLAAGPITGGEALPGTRSAPGIWERAPNDTRWNPYMFIKLPSTIIAEGEAIRLPRGRTQIDWECELGVVIGRQASRVPVAQSAGYIFGYTIQNDVSDRGGRGDTRYGSDWVVAKNHDTFGPLGPFITPKEFVPDPQKLTIRFWLNGQLMQEESTALMIHNVYEQVTYASHIMTLRPGDIIASGTPAGVGFARTPPVYFKPGDRSVCTYEGVGTLTNPVVGS